MLTLLSVRLFSYVTFRSDINLSREGVRPPSPLTLFASFLVCAEGGMHSSEEQGSQQLESRGPVRGGQCAWVERTFWTRETTATPPCFHIWAYIWCLDRCFLISRASVRTHFTHHRALSLLIFFVFFCSPASSPCLPYLSLVSVMPLIVIRHAFLLCFKKKSARFARISLSITHPIPVPSQRSR